MRVLVTGACGFVGQHLAAHLVACGDTVLGTVFSEAAQHNNRGYETAVLDVTSYKACSELIARFRPDRIYHLAGMAFVPEAEENFGRVLAINVESVQNVVRSAYLLQAGIRVLIVSSAEVYGKIRPENLPLTEATAVRPANNYSLSKAMAELVALRYQSSEQVRVVVARPFNHIGPGQNNRFVTSTFGEQLARIACGLDAPVLRVGNLDARRDFTDVRDIVRGYRLALEAGQGTYVFSSGKSVSIQSILDCLIEVSGQKVEIVRDPTRLRPSDVPDLYGSAARAKTDLGWEPKIPLHVSLKDIFEDWVIRLRGQ